LSDKGIRGGSAQEKDREEESEKGPQSAWRSFGEGDEKTRQAASENGQPGEQGEEGGGQIIREIGQGDEIEGQSRNCASEQNSRNGGECRGKP